MTDGEGDNMETGEASNLRAFTEEEIERYVKNINSSIVKLRRRLK